MIFGLLSRPCGALDCEANTYTGAVHTHTESIMLSQRTSMHTAGARMAGISSGGVGSADTYRDARQCLPIMK